MKFHKFIFTAQTIFMVFVFGIMVAACRQKVPQQDENLRDEPATQIESEFMEESKNVEPGEMTKKIDTLLSELRKKHSTLTAKEKELRQFQRELNTEQIRLANKETELRNRDVQLLEKENELRSMKKELTEQVGSFKLQRKIAYSVFAIGALMIIFSIFYHSIRKKQEVQKLASKTKEPSKPKETTKAKEASKSQKNSKNNEPSKLKDSK